MNTLNPEDKIQYNRLTDFIRRINNLNVQDSSMEQV